jgi:uncharacterized membrane protein
MTVIPAALLLGVIAGLRAMTAHAAISWAAYLGWLPPHHTPIALIGTTMVVIILTVLMIGALIRTLGGAAMRTWLATATARDLPAALIEDVAAVGGTALLVVAAP